MTHPHFFKSLITVYSVWVVESTVIAAGEREKEDESEDEDVAEGCHSEGKCTSMAGSIICF